MATGAASAGKDTAQLVSTAGVSALGGFFNGIRTGIHSLELLTLGSYKTCSTAFVTFRSRVACSMAYQMFLSTEHYTMRISPAPQPGDVLWNNVALSENQVQSRRRLADAAFAMGALFWSVVVSGIAAISNLDNLSQKYPWLRAYKNSYFYDILNSYLASLVLIIALAILPFIFDFSARHYEGIKLESRIQESIMKRFFYYQIVNVFVSVGLGSVVTQLYNILEQPEKLLQILGVSVPSFSVYFTNLLIVKAFTAVPFEMLRIWPLIQVLSLGSIIDEKSCSWRYLHTGIFATQQMPYSWIYPGLLMVLMIINIYCAISPMVVPFALVYYCCALFLYKYQMLYVYQNTYQAGGHLWNAVFRYSMISMILGTTTVLCYFAILRSFMTGPFYLLVPLPIIIYYYWSLCDGLYKDASQYMSLQSAVHCDQEYEDHLKMRAQEEALNAEEETKEASMTGTNNRELQSKKAHNKVAARSLTPFRRSSITVKYDPVNNQFVRNVQKVGGGSSHSSVSSSMHEGAVREVASRSSLMSVEEEQEDALAQEVDIHMYEQPIESFKDHLYVQPSLKAGVLRPLPYRQLDDQFALQSQSMRTIKAAPRSSVESGSGDSDISGMTSVRSGVSHLSSVRDQDRDRAQTSRNRAGTTWSTRSSFRDVASVKEETSKMFKLQESVIFSSGDDGFHVVSEPVGMETDDFTSHGTWDALCDDIGGNVSNT